MNFSLSPSQIAEKGEAVYQEKIKEILEPKENGRFVAIDVDSGEYFLGDDALSAVTTAREKYPTKLFHLMRVGFNSALQNNRLQRNSNLAYGRFF